MLQLFSTERSKVVPVRAMKAFRGAEVWLYSFITLAQNEGEFIKTMLQLFTSRGEARNPLKRRVNGPQSHSR